MGADAEIGAGQDRHDMTGRDIAAEAARESPQNQFRTRLIILAGRILARDDSLRPDRVERDYLASVVRQRQRLDVVQIGDSLAISLGRTGFVETQPEIGERIASRGGAERNRFQQERLGRFPACCPLLIAQPVDGSGQSEKPADVDRTSSALERATSKARL